MRNLGMRSTLVAVSFLFMGIAALAGGIYVEVELRGVLEKRAEANVSGYAHSLRELVERDGALAEKIPLMQSMAKNGGFSFSLYGADDEILAAFQAEPARSGSSSPGGISIPESTPGNFPVTLEQDLEMGKGGEAARLHVEMQAADVEEIVSRLNWALTVAALLALVVILFMTSLASKLITRTLRTLVVEAKAIAEGTGQGRIHIDSLSDDLENLAGSVNKMAGALEETVRQLAEERDRFQSVLDGMRGGVVAFDAGRNVALANRAARKLFAWEHSPVGKPAEDVMPVPELLDALKDGGTHKQQLEFAWQGERERRIVAHVSPQAPGEGIVLVFTDVTEIRKLESIRTDFVSNVSHELRTPVSVIFASAEALVSGGLSDGARAERFAAAVYKNADRLSRLVSDLLDLSRIESGKYGAGADQIFVNEVVERVVEHLEAVADKRGQSLTLHTEPDLFVQGDEVALEQILSNLLDNAIKYTPETGHVEVRARRERGKIRLEVEDDGPGVPDEHKNRIFERFYRMDAGRSREMGGTGLGLSIVKHLVMTFDGIVFVEDGMPGGSRFVVMLPELVLDAGPIRESAPRKGAAA